MKRAWLSWSSGKDAAWALHEIRQSGEYEITAALTTVTGDFGRVSMHGVREAILNAQCMAAGLAQKIVRIPFPCPNEIYEAKMSAMLGEAKREGVTHIVFGDLFLEDIRRYREEKMAGSGITPVFPLWGRPTDRLAHEMIAGGLEARLVCVDPKAVPKDFAGRAFDAALLNELPQGVDPCGERGEFHTCVLAGPMFSRRIEATPGEVTGRDGFVFADLTLA
ncbi:MAG TPA: ATP-binding protein [Xanthobacteraceae bacterium]|nr:ATP-binding protein [Xanthobacteraceae bacterium]